MPARFLIALALLPFAALAATEESSPKGSLIRYQAFPSRHVSPRPVTIWLPAGYHDSDRRYPVLYMHDGQNLFDPETAGPKGEWQVDETLSRLAASGDARPAIVVGVWNTPARLREYMPRAVFERLPPAYRDALAELYQGTPLSDAYLRFLVDELKPWIDEAFRTLPGRDDTFVAGSSMGGLISLYAISEYPGVFGGAAALSSHWPLFLSWPLEPRPVKEREAVTAAFAQWLADALPPPRHHRLWLDHGTETLDSLYAPYQARMDEVIASAGYERGRNWVSRVFPGAAHDEPAWRERLHLPLRFLLGERRQP